MEREKIEKYNAIVYEEGKVEMPYFLKEEYRVKELKRHKNRKMVGTYILGIMGVFSLLKYIKREN